MDTRASGLDLSADLARLRNQSRNAVDGTRAATAWRVAGFALVAVGVVGMALGLLRFFEAAFAYDGDGMTWVGGLIATSWSWALPLLLGATLLMRRPYADTAERAHDAATTIVLSIIRKCAPGDVGAVHRLHWDERHVVDPEYGRGVGYYIEVTYMLPDERLALARLTVEPNGSATWAPAVHP